ncbi:MAG: hypothetical protein ACOC2U_03805 [bacterium]
MNLPEIDKQIHANEFKLRILVTNDCNKSCKFCLNDFQPKPLPRNEKYICTTSALKTNR